MNRTALLLALSLGGAAMPAAALPPLGQQTSITDQLIETALAYEIGRVCDRLKGRRMEGVMYLLAIQAQAKSMGYSQAEIDAFVDDDAEKSRLEGLARDRLASMGAVPGDPDSHCRVGEAQIAAGSQIGRLLMPE